MSYRFVNVVTDEVFEFDGPFTKDRFDLLIDNLRHSLDLHEPGMDQAEGWLYNNENGYLVSIMDVTAWSENYSFDGTMLDWSISVGIQRNPAYDHSWHKIRNFVETVAC